VRIFGFIAVEKANHSVEVMCRVLGVSRAGFYAWLGREPSARAREDECLTERIREIHKENREVYGSPRIHAELRLADGVLVGRKRVERLMRAAGISGLQPKRRGVRRSVCPVCGSAMTSLTASSSLLPRTVCGSRI
jgi:putative transposase